MQLRGLSEFFLKRSRILLVQSARSVVLYHSGFEHHTFTDASKYIGNPSLRLWPAYKFSKFKPQTLICLRRHGPSETLAGNLSTTSAGHRLIS
jgi:hypothetical protein